MTRRGENDPAERRLGGVGKVGLAAVILLAPGGFVLGATLAARHLMRRAEARRAAEMNSSEMDPDGADRRSAQSPSGE